MVPGPRGRTGATGGTEVSDGVSGETDATGGTGAGLVMDWARQG